MRGEVIVVDNGSTDRSRDEALAAGARVVDESQRGYGAAHRRGFAEARGAVIVMADADDTYDLSDLGPLVEPLSHGYDMVVGNRLRTLSPGAMTWSHRFIGTPALTRFWASSPAPASATVSAACAPSRARPMSAWTLKSAGMELASEMILKGAREG